MEEKAKSMAARMAAVELSSALNARAQSDHEKLCAERWGSLRDDLKWTIRLLATLVVGVLGWVAIQAYHSYQSDVQDMRTGAAHVSP